MCQKTGVFYLFQNATINFFDFLHDDRGELCAKSGPGIGFLKKIIQGLAGD